MIIDFRVRPPTKGFLRTYHYVNWNRTERIATDYGLKSPSSALNRDMSLFLAEMDAAGVDRAVVVGRQNALEWGKVPNEDVAAIVAEHPDRIYGYGGVDGSDPDAAVAEAERAVRELGLRGIAVEPGFCQPPLYPDDESLYPIYAECERLKVPVMLTVSVLVGPDISYSDPTHIDRVAQAFPEVIFIIAHAAWPWVIPILGVAFKRENVYVLPDFYLLHMPGRHDYVEAANLYLKERLIFGSGYPIASLGESLHVISELPFRPDARSLFLGDNAARLLGLED